MKKMVFLKSDGFTRCYCTGSKYSNFLKYAFAKADFFMLVYVNYYGKGLKKQQKYYMKRLDPFKIKRRTNPKWPGVPFTYSKNTTYKVIFYKTDTKAMEILNEVSSLDAWSSPGNPEDLAFFIGNECWFYSVGHEKIAGFVRADCDDIEFMHQNGLLEDGVDVYKLPDYHTEYDEDLLQ